MTANSGVIVKLPNGLSFEVIPDGVLIEGQYKLDYESLVALMQAALVTKPLLSNDPREKFLRNVREAAITSAGDSKFIVLDILRQLARSKVGRERSKKVSHG
jgi:hypothetical protein